MSFLKEKKYFVILIFIVIGLLLFIFLRKPREEPFVDEEIHGLLAPLEEEEKKAVKKLREGPLSDIEDNIPPDAKYNIEYKKDITGEPIFLITVDAKNWNEYIKLSNEARQRFKGAGIDPCVPPLLDVITFTAKDWSNFDFSIKPQKEDPFCP